MHMPTVRATNSGAAARPLVRHARKRGGHRICVECVRGCDRNSVTLDCAAPGVLGNQRAHHCAYQRTNQRAHQRAHQRARQPTCPPTRPTNARPPMRQPMRPPTHRPTRS